MVLPLQVETKKDINKMDLTSSTGRGFCLYSAKFCTVKKKFRRLRYNLNMYY